MTRIRTYRSIDRERTRPSGWARWLYIVLVLAACIVTLWTVLVSVWQGIGGIHVAAAAAGWLLWSLLVGWLFSLTQRRHEPVGVGWRTAGYVWGLLPALLLAGLVNSWLTHLVPESATQFTAAIVAPIPEESAKWLGVLLLVLMAPRVFHNRLSILLGGLFVGLGFAAMENWRKTFDALSLAPPEAKPAAMLQWFVTRGLVDNPIAHLAFTVTTALGIVSWLYHRDRDPIRRVLVVIGFGLLGCLLHFVNNFLAAIGVGFTILYGLLMIALVIGLLLWARRRDRMDGAIAPA